MASSNRQSTVKDFRVEENTTLRLQLVERFFPWQAG